ncbi:leucine-rich repeat domain-containing protein [uncultured Alistipes sp.]|uniref:leucine-rich repeat domain-containing protein n=1 Tax=uncultured Alistipes sp. TaxID=538949 RepID=UPI00272D971A|nr:leucine-rich repeat domain-containing protein [uncultured Alistipes sp.]
MKKLFLLTALFVAAAFPSCSKHDGVETPDPQPLAIAFAEGNSLQFDAGETKTVHYTITGGNGNTIVTAEMQNPDDAYTVETTPISATEGTITITAKKPSNENRIIVTVSDGSQTLTAEIAVSTKPRPQELVITFAEGNLLLLNINEPKTVHYTITGGSDKTVVKAEMQNPDDAYTVETTPISATEGTITITAKKPSNENRIIVTVSDGSQTLTAEIAVSTNPRPQGITITVDTPGTLAELLADYDKSSITELTVIGNLNWSDIRCLNSNLRNLAILDMEHVNWEELPQNTFYGNKSLTFVKLPLTMKTIGDRAFQDCSSLTSITIPDSVTEIGYYAFYNCSSLTSVTIPDSVTSIAVHTFNGCSSLTSVTIGNSVTSIEYEAFYGCSSLTSVTIGNSVTSIGIDAFRGCSSLTSVTIGNSVTSIQSLAFQGCSSLTSVYCKAIVPPTITSSIFDSNVKATATLYVPKRRKETYAKAIEWSKFKTIKETQF